MRPPHLVLSVTTTDKKLAMKLRELAGGNVGGPYLYGRTKVFGSRVCAVKPQFHWRVESKFEVYRILKTILPQLIVKAKLARAAIAFMNQKYGWGTE